MIRVILKIAPALLLAATSCVSPETTPSPLNSKGPRVPS